MQLTDERRMSAYNNGFLCKAIGAAPPLHQRGNMFINGSA
jgi:hypothetical protein